MRTLAIDCATNACSAALFDGGELIGGAWEDIGRGHAERLVPMIAGLPERGRAARIAVSLGPGSFTGVRIGLAAARALGLAWGAEVLGYPTLSLIAAMARENAGSAVSVCMTGGHGEWFVQDFDCAGAPATPLASLPPANAAAHAGCAVVAGDRAQDLVAQRGHGRAIHLLPDARLFPLLPVTALTASRSPIYGRAPDAKPSAQITGSAR